MRQGQQNKRMRGRSRKGPNPLTRSFESNGPDVKIRGTALHIAEKYVQLARDAQTSGDRVAGESYLQHAEHFYRIVAAAQALQPQPPSQPLVRNDNDDIEEDENSGANDHAPQGAGDQQPSFGLSEPQPFINGNSQGELDSESSNTPIVNSNEGSGQTEQRDNRDTGATRSRRRRPYRERVNNDQGELQTESAPSSEEPEPAAVVSNSEE